MRRLILLTTALALIACETPSEAGDDKPIAETTVAAAETTPETTAAAETTAGEDAPTDIQIFPLQHGSFYLKADNAIIMVDPVKSALDAAEGDEPKADIIFVTHQHGDHLDPATIAALRKEGAAVVVPQKVADEAGEALPNPTVMANGDTKEFDVGVIVGVEAVPMYNLERKRENGEFFHPKGMGNGYVLTIAGKRIYISGDTECVPEMKALENIDMAFVCMNLPYTMTPDEAAVCIKEFKPKKLYPYHYRDQDPTTLQTTLKDVSEVEIVQLEWYP